MARTDEREIGKRFAERYRAPAAEVTREIETAVIGAAWGANGYTTVSQADVLARALALGDGARLLDIGAGRGWPGLYLAATTRCDVTLADLPPEGLSSAMARARSEQLGPRARAVVASARRLPFGRGSFDAIVHTDVLCCLRPKVAVLRECARVLVAGGRTAFYSIHPAPGLDRAGRRRAGRDGPVAVGSRFAYPQMLESAGFGDVCETDCTAEFALVARAWIDRYDERAAELESLLGAQAVAERQADRRAQLQAVEDGVLQRSLLTAQRPALRPRRTVSLA
jgi:ubiquinone/menaquinone biosynthesis C-methylase UbiE